MKKKMEKLSLGLIGTVIAFAMTVTQLPILTVQAKNSDTATADFQVNEGVLVKYQGTASTVSIPDGVEEIGEEAFAGNTTLVSVKIPSSVKKISYGAFYDCSSLERISIPKGTEELGNGVFVNCSSLSKVVFSESLETVGSGMFVGCNKLKKIDISSKNKYLTFYSGALYDKEKTVLIQMLPAREKSTFNFPSTVEEIRPYAFWGAKNLKKVLLSQKLHEIPPFAFSNCNALTGIEIPYSVYRIEMKAFENCENLEEVIIHPSVNSIHDSAFDGCWNVSITAEEHTYAYDFAQSHPTPEKEQPLYVVGDEENPVKEDLEENEEEQKDKTSENKTSNGNSNTNDGTGTKYVDPLEYPEDAGVLGKTRVVGNNAFVILDGSKTTVH